jgi:endonuclease/exonuclease/phosphatase family metal-dependent hydrolase
MMRATLAALVLLAVACRGEPEAPAMDAAIVQGHGSGITVMTRNIYVGADVDIVIGGDPSQIPLLVAQAFQEVLATNYPLRAELLADEIDRSRPHVIGLQEVSLIRIQDPGDLVVGGTTPATETFLDFLPILLDALTARGLDYRVVASVENTDVELPMVTSATPTFADVRLTDYDVILARGDVPTSNAVAVRYDADLPVPNTPIVLKRGYVAADATVGGLVYRVVNTHLESAHPLVRLAQASELAQDLAGETRPLIALGDFNSDPASADPTYPFLTGAGYDDAWLSRDGRPTQSLTCCQESDLANETSILDKRLDLVLSRNFAGDPVFADVVGDDPSERSGGLWPSDHAGVVARYPRR